ncbi:MAG: nuclear transport factor 2 family protein [Chloroflexota bacterium]
MRDLRALAPSLAIAMSTGLVLLVLAFLINTDASRFVVPQPDNVAEQFLRALGAGRYQAAHAALSEETQDQVSAERLREIAAALKRDSGGIKGAYAEDAEQSGERATTEARIVLENHTEQSLQFPLRREHGLWKIASVEALEGLGDQ